MERDQRSVLARLPEGVILCVYANGLIALWQFGQVQDGILPGNGIYWVW